MSQTKIEKLTAEQEAQIPLIRQKWLDKASQPIDQEKAKNAIAAIYKFSGKAMPDIVFVNSPASACLLIAMIKNQKVDERSLGDSLRDSLGASLGDSLRDSLGASLGDSLRDSLGASLGDSLRDSLWDSLRASLGASLGDSLRDSLGASLGDSLRDSLWDSLGASLGDSLRASLRDSLWDSLRASLRDSLGASLRDSLGDSLRASLGASLGDSLRASLRDSLWDSLRASLRDSLGASLRDSLGASLRDSLGASLGDSLRASLRDSLWDSLRDSLRDSLWDSLGDSLRASLRDSLWDSLRASLGASLRDSLRDSLGASLGDSLRASLGASLRDSLRDSFSPEWLSAWAAFFEAGRLAGVEFGRQYELFQQYCEEVGWIFPYEKLVIACDRPSKVLWDADGRIHGEGESAVQFEDGFGVWAWHGTRLPEKYWMHPAQWQAQWLLEERNAELRRALIEGIGYGRICQELEATAIDSWREYSLLRIEQDVDVEPIHLLKMTCPSTNHIHVLRTPPNIFSAQAAITWCNWGVNPETFAVET